MSVGNAMVLTNGYGIADPQQTQPKVVAYYTGSGEEMYIGQDVWEAQEDLPHQKAACAEVFISNIGFRKTIEE